MLEQIVSTKFNQWKMVQHIQYARWKHAKNVQCSKILSRLRQACGIKKAAEGVVITVPVHSVYFAVYHRKYLARLTGLRTFAAQARCLKTLNVRTRMFKSIR